jgi:hypothetical protein
MIEPEQTEGNLAQSAPAQPALLALLDLSGPLALMPGPPVVRPALDPGALARAIEEAVAPVPLIEPMAADPPESDAAGLVESPYTRPRRLRSAVVLMVVSVILGALLAAAIGVTTAVTVAAVNRAVNSSSTSP